MSSTQIILDITLRNWGEFLNHLTFDLGAIAYQKSLYSGQFLN
ncbi:hypothetical protein [Leptothermofonsia sp. ETS-13]